MHQHFTITTHSQWKQYIDAPSYFRGSIVSDNPIQAIYVTDSSGSTVRQLIQNGEQEAEVFLYLDHADHYIFHLVPQPEVRTCVTIALHAVPLKNDQYLSPKHTIISPLLFRTAQRIAQHDAIAETTFWTLMDKRGTPLIEESDGNNTIVTFLYQGDTSTKNVLVLGAPYDGQVQLAQIPNSNIWFKSYEIPNSSRFSYRIAVNVPQLADNNWTEQYLAAFSTIKVDPKNHQPQFNHGDALFGSASTLTLAQAPSDSTIEEHRAPKGSVKELQYYSQQLNNTRTVHLYQPHTKYPLDASSPLLISFDGSEYLSKVPTPVILDNLIAQGRIPPMRAVFIDTPSPKLRAQELTPNAAFANFLATEFKPWLCESLNIRPDAKNTILSGSSFGGLASLYIAYKYPEQFGKVLSQSGSFWWAPQTSPQAATKPEHWFADIIIQEPTQPIDIYMNAGLFEIKPKSYEILETNRKLVSALKTRGYRVTFEEVACGHDYFSWRVTLAHGLTALFNHPQYQT